MSPSTTNARKIWVPLNLEATEMYHFMLKINQTHDLSIQNYEQLYQYSISNRSQFWSDWFEYANIIYSGSYEQAVDESLPIDAIPQWFSGITLNFAENVLFSRLSDDDSGWGGTRGKEDDKIAVTEVFEGGTEINNFNWGMLRSDSAVLASALKSHGIGRGDRVFVVGSNSYTTLTLFLATSWVGAIFASTSPDMGTHGILQRVKQTRPKLVFMDDGAKYNGQTSSLLSKASEVVKESQNQPTFIKLVVIPRVGKVTGFDAIPQCVTLAEFVSKSQDKMTLVERIPFHEPCLISYSSGTTGDPKCIIHSVGGIVLNTLKEGILHGDLTSDSTLLQFTTTGWIMYLACVAALIPGARTVLYDGSPFFPKPNNFIKLLETQKVTSLGTSPRWMTEIRKIGISPKEIADLSRLQSVSSTGMVLSDQLFEWFYEEAFPRHVRLANMSGGTDIAGCFAIGNPISPLYVGGCQGPSLGVAIDIYEPETAGGKGASVSEGRSGELVAVESFPNIPISFWNDEPPSSRNSRYFSSYFAKYKHTWAQGDFVSIDPATKAIIFHGRSDGVLNPSGIRFGSSEIYSVLERNFSTVIEDSICVGQRRRQDLDEQVLLFVQMRRKHTLSEDIVQNIKDTIRKDLSSRHIPKYVFEVPEIPVTATLKKVELPVKHIVSGRSIKPSGSIANPKSLNFFYKFVDVEKMVQKPKL